MRNLVLMLFMVLFITGCTVRADTPNKVIIKEDEIRIENSNDKFCPPGQAKKGRC